MYNNWTAENIIRNSGGLNSEYMYVLGRRI